MTTKEKIYQRDGGRCRYCGCMLELWQATTDHVIPRKQGGSNKRENIVTACPRCNSVKSDRTVEEAGMRLWSLEEFEALAGAHSLNDSHSGLAPGQAITGDGAQYACDSQRSSAPIPLEESGGGAHVPPDAHKCHAPAALGGESGAQSPDDSQKARAPALPPHWLDSWPYPQEDITVNEFDALYRDFKQYQKMRIQRENYIRGRTQLGLEIHPRLLQSLLIYESLEKQAEKDLELVKEDYLWSAFDDLKGIGLVLAAGIRGLFDPLPFPNVQKAWKYAGYAVINGEGQRKKKGQKAGFCVPLKTRLWQAADCLWKANPEWRQIGRDYKARQLWLHRHDGTIGSNGKGIRGHAHNRAMRFLAKRLVKYLWCYAHKAPMSKARGDGAHAPFDAQTESAPVPP